MKFKIIIPDFIQNINDTEYFEYSLGWFEFETKEMRVNFFKADLCMVFLTLDKFIENISYLEKNTSEKAMWIGEDNGKTFTMSIKNNKICISDNSLKVCFKTKKLKKAIRKGLANFITKMQKHYPDIVYKKLFYTLTDYQKTIINN